MIYTFFYNFLIHIIDLCFIQRETFSSALNLILHNFHYFVLETGAVSTDHPAHPRAQKERERDRGLRFSRPIVIETYSNQLWLTTEIEPTLAQLSLCPETSTVAGPTSVMSDSASSRERTPLELPNQSGVTSAAASSELPKEICFFSGNPSVEVTNGIIHLYKKKFVA